MKANIWAIAFAQALCSMAPGSAMAQAGPDQEHRANPEARLFSPTANAQLQLNQALAVAESEHKRVVVVMGADWCHDSRALAGWLETPRFTEMMKDRYLVIFVDVGTPQIGKGRNLDIAKHFGIRKVKGTPLLMVVSADGKRLNSKRDAASWRNAASRTEQSVFAYFDSFTPA
ncbi:MAG: thioredoxin family protein [Sphingorhabdus sp.]